MNIKKEAMYKKIIEYNFFWPGYTKAIEEFIKNCGVCHTEINVKKIEYRPIKTYNPHI